MSSLSAGAAGVAEREDCSSRGSLTEADLASVEMGLESGDFGRVIDGLDRIRSENPSYQMQDLGYLVDFYAGQAVFRREMGYKRRHDELVKAKTFFEDSLSLNPDFADGHFLEGYVSMVLAGHPDGSDSVYHLLDSRHHFGEAVEKKPELEDVLVFDPKVLDAVLVDIPKVILCSVHEGMVSEWAASFEKYPWVEVRHADITEQRADAAATPGNSFGFMDGSLDYSFSEYFGWHVQGLVQERIKERHNGELLVGDAEIVETGNSGIPRLVYAPTMRVPMNIEGTVNPYLATRAVFLSVNRHNNSYEKGAGNVVPIDSPLDLEGSSGQSIDSILVPSMGTGVGRVPFNIAARQMKAAYEDVILARGSYPAEFSDAKRRHDVLSSDHFFDLYGGKD